MDAGRVERAPVVRHVVIGAGQRFAQPRQLQRRDLVAARVLDRIEAASRHRSHRHVHSLETTGTTGLPFIVYDRPRNTAMRSPRWFVTTTS